MQRILHSSNTMSRRNTSTNRSNIEENDPSLEDAIKECVRFVVCRESNKIPIKRAEIIKHLGTVCETPTNKINAVIIEANKALKKVYGYKLIQVEAKSGIQYIVVLTEECASIASSVVDTNNRKLLTAALLHIFMSGGPIKEDDMYKFLSEAGLMDENDNIARKTLTNVFTRQLYLSLTKMGEGDLARNVFEWGQRATEEVPKMFLLNKMAEAMGKNPDHWCEQHKIATQSMNEEQSS